MKKANVDFVFTCMDLQGVVTLAKEIKKQQLKAVQYLPNGYDPTLLEEFGDLFEGSYVGIAFVPFEAKEKPKSLQTYLEWMDKTGAPKSELTMNGWLSAELFVEGLRGAGPAFDRQKVVDAINKMTNWNADGLNFGVDWTTAHTQSQPQCTAVVKIQSSKFVPQLDTDKHFTCFDSREGPLVEPRQV
jgi:ABC-type branched-subunit amino acid transport system substrate-binding protein